MKLRRKIFWPVWLLLLARCSQAAQLTEFFTTDPLANGWRIFGDTNLFQWDVSNQNLAVTWDSSRTNSYFYHPLNTILTTNDTFSVEFDLQLKDAAISGYGFELAVGLFNFGDATGPEFFRGSGHSAPNLVEFDYFPDFGWGATVSATTVDGGGANFIFSYDIQPLDDTVAYHVVLNHSAGTPAITGLVFADGQPFSALPITYYSKQFFGFQVDTLSVSSFSDASSGGSILAHGIVDNLAVIMPEPPVQNLSGSFTNHLWQASFLSRSNWLYTLERTTDFQTWTNVSPSVAGNATNLFLQDTNPSGGRAFYRVRGERP